MAFKAIDIANALLKKAKGQGIAVSNMKLQKLLYYLQGWHLAVRAEEGFPEDFKKWAWGPVVPPVYNKFKKYGAEDIEKPQRDPPELPGDLNRAVDFVLKHYGHYTAVQLAHMSHEEAPYLNTEEYETISKVEILRYFCELRERLSLPGNLTTTYNRTMKIKGFSGYTP